MVSDQHQPRSNAPTTASPARASHWHQRWRWKSFARSNSLPSSSLEDSTLTLDLRPVFREAPVICQRNRCRRRSNRYGGRIPNGMPHGRHGCTYVWQPGQGRDLSHSRTPSGRSDSLPQEQLLGVPIALLTGVDVAVKVNERQPQDRATFGLFPGFFAWEAPPRTRKRAILARVTECATCHRE